MMRAKGVGKLDGFGFCEDDFQSKREAYARGIRVGRSRMAAVRRICRILAQEITFEDGAEELLMRAKMVALRSNEIRLYRDIVEFLKRQV